MPRKRCPGRGRGVQPAGNPGQPLERDPGQETRLAEPPEPAEAEPAEPKGATEIATDAEAPADEPAAS